MNFLGKLLGIIKIGPQITLTRKAIGKVDLRQGLLLLLAVAQAVWLLFYVNAIPFVVRLVIGMFGAIVLITIATQPFHGTTFERAILEMLGERFGHKRYLHQTAKGARDAQPESNSEPEMSTATNTAAKPARVRYAGAGALVWASPNFGVLMFAFMCLVTLASCLAYATRGDIPGFTR